MGGWGREVHLDASRLNGIIMTSDFLRFFFEMKATNSPVPHKIGELPWPVMVAHA